MDGILGIQNRFFWFFSVTEETDVVVNLIADDVWGSEDELRGVLSEKLRVGIDYVYKFVLCLFPSRIVEQII